MLIFVLFLVVIESHTTLSQFPNHLDVQKVGEIIINNEKYNVLKPSLHLVTDYFEDYMLRRENKDFPTKRIFIDRNGFRHFWSGFEDNKENLRKSDDVISNNKENDVTAKATGTTKDITYTNNTTVRKWLQRHKRKKKRVYSMPFVKKVVQNDELLREGGKERTMATTTFFCPFFGVITMNAFID